MKQLCWLLAILSCLAMQGLSGGIAQAKGHADGDHVVLRPGAIKLGPAPASLPAGAQFSALVGDPTKEGGFFTIRAKLPDGYKVPPHWHPTDENVTVLAGTLMIGKGEKFDAATAEKLPAG